MAKRKQWRDPFADYIEWTEHRYDPGYYLGGRIPPHLKKANLGPKGRRNGGILLLVFGLAGFLQMFMWPLDTAYVIIEAFYSVLVTLAGLVMLLARDTESDSKTRRK